MVRAVPLLGCPRTVETWGHATREPGPRPHDHERSEDRSRCAWCVDAGRGSWTCRQLTLSQNTIVAGGDGRRSSWRSCRIQLASATALETARYSASALEREV